MDRLFGAGPAVRYFAWGLRFCGFRVGQRAVGFLAGSLLVLAKFLFLAGRLRLGDNFSKFSDFPSLLRC